LHFDIKIQSVLSFSSIKVSKGQVAEVLTILELALVCDKGSSSLFKKWSEILIPVD